MPHSRRATLALGLACASLAFAGCGGDKESEATQSNSSAPAATATPSATPQVATTKPVVKVPRGKLPKKLVKKDLKVGTGAAAKPGQTVSVQYVGVSALNGRQFDASWDRGQPFQFPLGQGQVIKGWDEGVAGMRVGGRRMLIIPPKLAYGAQGSPPTIGPNETLVFVIDLLGVQ
jgi:peptidylprolyl isomerase